MDPGPFERRNPALPGRPNRVRRSGALWLLFAAVLLTGCFATSGTGPSRPFSDVNRSGSIQLLVENLNFADTRLFWIRGGTRRSLGTVGGKQTETFTIRWNFSDPLRIEINLLAGPTCTTREIVADPGDILELQIASVFSQSSFCR